MIYLNKVVGEDIAEDTRFKLKEVIAAKEHSRLRDQHV